MLLGGETGLIYITNFTLNTAYKLEYNGSTQHVGWLASASSFLDYFRGLSSLTVALQVAQQYGTNISLTNLSQVDSQILDKGLEYFEIDTSSQEFLHLVTALAIDLHGNLGSLYINNGYFNTSNNLKWYIKLNLGFSTLLKTVQIRPVPLQLDVIFSASSGVEALIRLLGQIGVKYDLTKVFPGLFSNVSQIVNLLGDVSGGSNRGLDGLITIIVKIINVLDGHDTLVSVFNAITRYNASSSGDTNLTAVTNEVVQLAAAQNNLYNNSAQFKIFLSFFQQLGSSNFTWNNINLSDVIKLLDANNPSGQLNAIITIVKKASPNGVSQFVSYVFGLLNSTRATVPIERLFPGLNLNNLTGSGNILRNILQQYNLTQMLAINSNITAALSQVPVLGPIFGNISASFGKGIENFLNASQIIAECNHFFNGSFGGVIGGFINPGSFGGIISGINNVVNSIAGTFGSLFGFGKLQNILYSI